MTIEDMERKEKALEDLIDFIEKEEKDGAIRRCRDLLDVLNESPLVSEDGEIFKFVGVAEEMGVYLIKNKVETQYFEKLNLGCFVRDCIRFTEKAIVENSRAIVIPASRDFAKIVSLEDNAQIAVFAKFAQIVSNGDNVKISSGGNDAQIISNGLGACITASGNDTQIASNGDDAKIIYNGVNSHIISNGSNVRIADSGIRTYMVSCGDNVQIASCGEGAQIAAKGKNTIIAAIGKSSIARAQKGSWITLAEWVKINKPGEKENWNLKCVKTERVDGERIKEDTFYKLAGGKFEETIGKNKHNMEKDIEREM